jgi:xylulokinase
MSDGYILSHDLGTSGNKATLFTTEGKLVSSVTSSYGTRYSHNTWAEQDPADWWRAVCDSSRKLLEGAGPKDIRAVALSGQMMGCLCVDTKGRPLRNALIYCDQRAEDQVKQLEERLDPKGFYRITGHRISSSYSVEKFMWIRDNEPDIYDATAKMLHAKDYINYKLTGRMVSEYSDASGTNLLNLETLDWSDEIIDAAGIDPDKLPALVKSTDIVGEVTREAAEATGLAAGTPVAAGAGDGLCAGVGVGSVKPGSTYNYLGSSSWIATTAEEPLYDPDMRSFVWAHAVPGLYHPCGTMQTAGSSFTWLKEQICRAETAEAEADGTNPFELINRAVEASPAGARGLIFLPYLLGERSPRWNPRAKGGLIGLTMEHTREDVCRAVVEGVILNLNVILEIIKEFLPVKEITVIGGGARGPVWRRIMADIYGAEILMPDYLEEATAMGAAIIGGVGAGVFESFDVIDRFISIQERTSPDPAAAAVYDTKKEVFEKCYQALEPVFPYVGITDEGDSK